MTTRSQPFVVVHVPHAATVIPAKVHGQFLLSDDELQHELLLMTDRYVDELFALSLDVATTVRYAVSRLVVDPERFVDDDKEPMAERGMGAVYMKTHDGHDLRRSLSEAQRQQLLTHFYRPHHQKLADAVKRALDTHGRCLLVDAHSFPSAPLPYEPDQRSGRPAICVGTDEFHTPEWLAQSAHELFSDAFESVAMNRPFAGSLVPMPYYHSDSRVISLMIEVNRGLYMDESSGMRLPHFEEVAVRLRATVTRIVAAVGR